MKIDKSAKNDVPPTKKLHHIIAFRWKVGASLDSIIETDYNTVDKIDAYAGGFSFGNNAFSIDNSIFFKNRQILHVIFENEYHRDSLCIPPDLQMGFTKKTG